RGGGPDLSPARARHSGGSALVSTILEALRLREPRLTPASGRPTGWTDVREWAPWRWALVVGLAAAAAGLPLMWRGVAPVAPRPRPRPSQTTPAARARNASGSSSGYIARRAAPRSCRTTDVLEAGALDSAGSAACARRCAAGCASGPELGAGAASRGRARARA